MKLSDCLNSEAFEAMAAGSPSDDLRDTIEAHIGQCQPCRRLLVEMRLKDEVVPSNVTVPDSLRRRATQIPYLSPVVLPFRRQVPIRRYVGIAASLVIVAAAALVVVVRFRDERLAPKTDVLRNGVGVEVVPRLVSPAADAKITADRIEFRWTQVPATIRYTLTIQDQSGDIIYEQATGAHELTVNLDRARLQPGHHYFWSVSATLADGSAARAEPSKFTLNLQ